MTSSLQNVEIRLAWKMGGIRCDMIIITKDLYHIRYTEVAYTSNTALKSHEFLYMRVWDGTWYSKGERLQKAHSLIKPEREYADK